MNNDLITALSSFICSVIVYISFFASVFVTVGIVKFIYNFWFG